MLDEIETTNVDLVRDMSVKLTHLYSDPSNEQQGIDSSNSREASVFANKLDNILLRSSDFLEFKLVTLQENRRRSLDGLAHVPLTSDTVARKYLTAAVASNVTIRMSSLPLTDGEEEDSGMRMGTSLPLWFS